MNTTGLRKNLKEGVIHMDARKQMKSPMNEKIETKAKQNI
jgi:hypothetical protein